MFSQLSYYIFSILILLIFTPTRGSNDTCRHYEKPCYNYSVSWCCPDDEYCGNFYSCQSIKTTTIFQPDFPILPSDRLSDSSSDSSWGNLGWLAILPFLIACALRICYSCSRQEQRSRSPRYNTNLRTVPIPYQQRRIHTPPRIVHVRPDNNVSAVPPIPSMHEAPPPSYEAATINLPPPYSSTPPTPVTAMV